jgi:hypothetical protein
VTYTGNTTEYANGIWMRNGVSEAEKNRVEAADRTSPYSCGAHPRLLESMGWVWTPNTCRLREFDSQHFNELLGGRSLVFIGDSISNCMADSLRFLGVDNKQTRFDLFAGYMDGPGRNGENKHVPPSSDDPLYVEKLSKLLHTPWLEKLREFDVKSTDILIVNKGAHGNMENLSAYQALAHRVSKLHPGQVLWRTTIQGHKDCQNFDGPIQNLSEDKLKELASSYNWATFKERNNRAIKAFSEEMRGRFGVVDTSMFENRPDGHISQVFRDSTDNTNAAKYLKNDCLHYCTPGPIDTWNYLLYHVLVAMGSTEY